MSIRRNTIYNVAGALIPVVLSLVTVPVYLKLIGAERYGVLAIAWLMLGYFGRLDLGLGRATSFRMASLRSEPIQARATAFWSALTVNAGMGVLGFMIFWAAGAYFFGHSFKAEPGIRMEILAAVPLLATAAPIATVSGVLTGALEGNERFLLTNSVATISNTFFQLIPLAVAWLIGPNLALLLAGALSARLIALVVLGFLAYRAVAAGAKARVSREEAVTLLKFGSWVNLVSIFAPIMQIMDRFAIGALHGPVAVTIYTIPFQLAQRVAILPNSLTGAAFPRLSAGTKEARDALSERTLKIMLALVSLPIIIGIFAMQPFLVLWIGADMGVQSAPVGRILLIAFWFNAFALVGFVTLQASARPDIVAKFILAEVPIYLGALYLALKFAGFEACALVFAVRCLCEYVGLNWLSARRISNIRLQAPAFALLVIATVLAGLWPSLTDWRLWACTTAMSLLMAGLCWLSTPADIQTRLLAARPVRMLLSRVGVGTSR